MSATEMPCDEYDDEDDYDYDYDRICSYPCEFCGESDEDYDDEDDDEGLLLMSANAIKLAEDILTAIDSEGPFLQGEYRGIATIEGTIDFRSVADAVLRTGWRPPLTKTGTE